MAALGKQSRTFRTRSLAACILAAAIIALCACVLPNRTALAATADIELSAETPTANIPFTVQGMLPGDVESLNAQVKVTHADAGTVHFKVENLEDTKGLADVLELSVMDHSTGKVIAAASATELAQGKATEISLDTSKQESRLDWIVTATLPSSAGNEYQNASCSFDLVWSIQVDDGETPTPPVGPNTPGGLPGFIGGLLPTTGDSVLWMLLFVALCAGALAMFRVSGRLARENVRRGGGLLRLALWR